MKRRLAALLRRWADRLDPRPVAQTPSSFPFALPERPARFRVLADGVEVYAGNTGALARRMFEGCQDPKRHTDVVIEKDGRVVGRWARGW